MASTSPDDLHSLKQGDRVVILYRKKDMPDVPPTLHVPATVHVCYGKTRHAPWGDGDYTTLYRLVDDDGIIHDVDNLMIRTLNLLELMVDEPPVMTREPTHPTL